MTKACILCGHEKSKGSNTSLIDISKFDEHDSNTLKNYFKKHKSLNGFVCSDHFEEKYLIRRKGRTTLNKSFFLNSITPLMSESEDISNQALYPDESCYPYQILNPTLPERSCSLFGSIVNNEVAIFLPPLWGMHKLDKYVIFSKFKSRLIPKRMEIEKSITLSQEGKIIIIVNGTRLTNYTSPINSANCLEKLIFNIDKKELRTGKCNKIKTSKDKIFYLKKKNQQLQKIVARMRLQEADQNKLENLCESLPEKQKELVKSCIQATVKNKHGLRYSLNWIYSCILMRIKSPKLYNHIRQEGIMTLPHHTTLLRYIRKIDGNFGFKQELFNTIKEKTKHMPSWECHGVILIDECKITPSKHFNKHQMAMFGFVNLGKYTPEKDENKLGDHALVFMFQPLCGRSIQALACFLSKGNVTGDVQAKLVLECVIMCENSGLQIHAITSDGASWNRAMWHHFGVEDPSQPWCTHPVCDERLLRFISDFPHLIKCLRNLLLSKGEFHIPEGVVKHAHFDALFRHEEKQEFKIAYKLTKKHVWPTNFEKMSAKLAFQLFSNTVALALETYKDKNPELRDCEPTIQFCRRINRIVDIMNSNKPYTALKPKSAEYEELENFLVYLQLWEQSSPPEFFLSRSTFEGLKATISSTLNLVNYATTNIGLKYLMTSRLNQDALEHFFGMMRSAGGCNNHPESLQVGQIFRLMSIYSLIKPPRGSNVSGGEMLQTLLNVDNDNIQISPAKQMKLTFNLILDENGTCQDEEFNDNEEAFGYLCGYVAKKFKDVECVDCKKTVIGQGMEAFNKVIHVKSRGYLTFPSETLFKFLMEVEKIIHNILKQDLQKDVILTIVNVLNSHTFKYFLGCSLHFEQITHDVLQHFIIIRLSITCQKEAKKREAQRKTKHYAKLAKLT